MQSNYTETVEGMVNKRNASRDARNFFNSLVLLNNPRFLEENPKYKGEVAMCILCGHVGIEAEFFALYTHTFIPYNGSRRFRQGICAECSLDTSKE